MLFLKINICLGVLAVVVCGCTHMRQKIESFERRLIRVHITQAILGFCCFHFLFDISFNFSRLSARLQFALSGTWKFNEHELTDSRVPFSTYSYGFPLSITKLATKSKIYRIIWDNSIYDLEVKSETYCAVT